MLRIEVYNLRHSIYSRHERVIQAAGEQLAAKGGLMITIAVDDKSSISQQIRDAMIGIDPEGEHYAVSDPEEALALIETAKPDVLWTETEMPAMSGFELASKAKRSLEEINIVFVTEHPKHALDAFYMHASGYLIKPVTEEQLRDELSNLRYPVRSTRSDKLRVQCFGYFEVFGSNGLIKFKRSLSKEAFAYLIDRRGAGCTVGELCSVLWEDRQADRNLKSQCRVIMAALKKDLSEAGYEEVIIKKWNTWAVDPDQLNCDYYDYLKRDFERMEAFQGEYLSQYSWAEMTAGVLYELTKDGNSSGI